ncbi:hypothetical protein PFISCL1PPCAC_24727, partial [Pristionchus fissidentatus]
MSFESASVDSYKGLVAEPTEYHQAAIGNGKVWIFSRKYADQRAFNWGHRVHYVGGYAIPYDPATKKYGTAIEIPAISAEEDAEELIFSHNGHVFLLLTNAFGEPAFRSLHKWTEKSWEKVADFGSPSVGEDRAHIYWALADGNSKGDKIIIGKGNLIKLFRLKIDDTSASISLEYEISQDVNFLSACPVGGVVSGDSVLVSLGVHGCGFRWENSRFIKVDLTKKSAEIANVEGEYDTLPTFCFSGPYLKALTKGGDWVAVAGSTQMGMTGSKFNDQVWKLSGLHNELCWTKCDTSVPAVEGDDFVGAYDESIGIVYVITSNAV